MPDPITSLIEKLEGDEGPSLVLDGEIWCAVNGYTFVMWDGAGCVYRRASDGGISHEQASRIRPFSASLDAALALAERVLPRLTRIEIDTCAQGEFHHCAIETDDDEFDVNNCRTPALALCAAVLRAQSEARATGEDSPANEGKADTVQRCRRPWA